MVSRFAMESQDSRMCKSEAGVTFEYNTHRTYDEDCFGDILNMLDFPMESLEVDGFAEDWASKLGPIPSEVFKEVVLPPSGPHIGSANNFGSHADSSFENHNNQTCYRDQESYYKNYKNVNNSQPKEHTTFVEDIKPNPSSQASFEAPSPNSVLESRSSSNNKRGVLFGTAYSIPVKSRSKRVRPTTNTWLMSPFVVLPKQGKKRKEASQIPVTVEPERSFDAAARIKKCSHCEITKTPQWREGPLGPKTLCNACGVRYRSGRLFPEYRPAASPTFVADLHSNCHRKVIEMRQKGVEKAACVI